MTDVILNDIKNHLSSIETDAFEVNVNTDSLDSNFKNILSSLDLIREEVFEVNVNTDDLKSISIETEVKEKVTKENPKKEEDKNITFLESITDKFVKSFGPVALKKNLIDKINDKKGKGIEFFKPGNLIKTFGLTQNAPFVATIGDKVNELHSTIKESAKEAKESSKPDPLQEQKDEKQSSIFLRMAESLENLPDKLNTKFEKEDGGGFFAELLQYKLFGKAAGIVKSLGGLLLGPIMGIGKVVGSASKLLFKVGKNLFKFVLAPLYFIKNIVDDFEMYSKMFSEGDWAGISGRIASTIGAFFLELPEMIINGISSLLGFEFKVDLGKERINKWISDIANSEWLFNNITVPVGDFLTQTIPEAIGRFTDFMSGEMDNVMGWINEVFSVDFLKKAFYSFIPESILDLVGINKEEKLKELSNKDEEKVISKPEKPLSYKEMQEGSILNNPQNNQNNTNNIVSNTNNNIVQPKDMSTVSDDASLYSALGGA